ncbi:MAG: DedA family protein [Candidatus Saccharimonadales bacterium]
MTNMQQLPAFVNALKPLVDNYGYLAVGGLLFLEDFGVPVPGETTLIAAAVFAGAGQLNIILVFLVGFAAAVLGDNLGFAIGTFGGQPLLERFGKYIFLTPERLQKAENYFTKKGGRIVVVARFIEGLRQANGIIAGLSDMTWRKFLSFNVLGAALWVGLWTSVGYFGGRHINTFLHYQLIFAIVVVACGLIYVGYRIFKHKRKDSNQASN